MPKKSIGAVAMGAFLILAAGVWWYGIQSARTADASLVAVTQKLASVESDIRQAQARIAARKSEGAALQARLTTLHSLKEAPQAAAPTGRIQPKNPATLTASDPKLRELYLKTTRANLMVRYGSIYQSLGLTPSQIDKFEDLATTHADDLMTMRAAALAQGLELSDPGFVALQKQSNDQFYTAITSDVGPGISEQLTQLQRTQGAQGFVNDIDSMIATGSPPLTAAQSSQLVQLLANNTPSYQKGGSVDANAIDWNSAYAQAASVLSGAQLEAFQAEAQMFRIAGKTKQFYSQQSGK